MTRAWSSASPFSSTAWARVRLRRWACRRCKSRLELSRAKHPSLAGHARLARRIAALVPGYGYDEERFFRADGAPDEIEARRRAGFARLSALYRERFANTLQLTDGGEGRAVGPAVHLRLPRALPVQRLRAPPPAGRRISPGIPTGPLLTDLDGNRLYDLAGSYGVNVFGHEFYKSCMAEGAARAAALGAVLGAYHPGGGVQRAPPARGLGARRGVVPHVGHRGGHAGGAPRALPHAALAPRALLRRLPRLVGGRAAGGGQSDAGPGDLHAEGHGRGLAARARAAARHRLRARQPGAGALPEQRRPRPTARSSTAAAAPGSTAAPTQRGSRACARYATRAASR